MRIWLTDCLIDGFDVVAECTGVESIVNDAINYVSRGMCPLLDVLETIHGH